MKNYPLALVVAIGFDLLSVINLTFIGLVPEFILTIIGIFAINYLARIRTTDWRLVAINGIRVMELIPLVDLFPFFTMSVVIQWLLGW